MEKKFSKTRNFQYFLTVIKNGEISMKIVSCLWKAIVDNIGENVESLTSVFLELRLVHEKLVYTTFTVFSQLFGSFYLISNLFYYPEKVITEKKDIIVKPLSFSSHGESTVICIVGTWILNDLQKI